MAAPPFPPIDDPARLERLLAQPAVALWFGTPDCAVCHGLRPKVEALLAESFPRLATGRIDCAAQPALAARFGVFSVPLLLVCFEGRETLRLSRNFALAELRRQLARPYRLLFGPLE